MVLNRLEQTVESPVLLVSLYKSPSSSSCTAKPLTHTKPQDLRTACRRFQRTSKKWPTSRRTSPRASALAVNRCRTHAHKPLNSPSSSTLRPRSSAPPTGNLQSTSQTSNLTSQTTMRTTTTQSSHTCAHTLLSTRRHASLATEQLTPYLRLVSRRRPCIV